jgi:transcription-repair coupling factor (superfamily II helicase)
MSLNFLGEVAEFRRFLQSVQDGEKGLAVAGLIEPARPFFLASLVQNLKKRIVYIQPVSLSLAKLEEQCRFYLSQFSRSYSLNSLPALSNRPFPEISPSLDAASTRMKFFYDLLHRPPSLVITNIFALLGPFPSPRNLSSFFLELRKSESVIRDDLLMRLSEFGYAREDLVATPGEFAWRGGIVDVYSPWQSFPFRFEFSGEEIASLREFDPSTQRTSNRLDRAVIPSLREYPAPDESQKGQDGQFVSFDHYLKDALLFIDGYEEVAKEWEEAIRDYSAECQELQKSGKSCLPVDVLYPPHLWEKVRKEAVVCPSLSPPSGKKTFHFLFQSVPRFANKIPFFLDYMKRLQQEAERCSIFLSNQVIRQKLRSLLSQNQIAAEESSDPFAFPRDGAVSLQLGNLEQGFCYSGERIHFFAERDIFTEEKVIVSRPAIKPFLSQFQDLQSGDYIVHNDYGVGMFRGLLKLDVDDKAREFIEIVYRDDDKLFVPVEDLNLVQKYSKVGESLPPLDKLGTSGWQKTKERTKKLIENMARELLQLYAQRKSVPGFSFSPEGAWQADFDRAFEFEETEDQLRSIIDIKKDMEAPFPMDRLLCGDVGYGKTEVAMRAAFKAVMDGKQVAVLCPTTVLASQHLKTFRTRMALFPVKVEALTRLQTKHEQKKIVEGLKKGYVDIVIGTHRLLSRDVEFHDVGLLVVDEEQRFGVSHKEKIKKLKAHIDVLTMTATPIPRTLNLSLAGLRDISLIETPPKDRLAVHTVVTTFSPKLVASAAKQELGRGGQVYYVHNRIEDIGDVAGKIEKLVPQAKVTIIHGQMSGAALERRMMDFVNNRSNVLVSTTIIENGIDIPLVNTLIVDRADLYGLAQLYQLRGRVGLSARQAYAYFLVPPFYELTPLAKKRLAALKEFSELGSGFRLAAKDLEIRGAGNLLGAEQHGYIEAVGFDYFMHLLDRTIQELKGEKLEEVKSEINLKADIRIPEDYLPQMNLRLNLYKRISSAETLGEIDKMKEEIEDRFGPLPEAVGNLLLYGAVKHLAQKLRIEAIDRVGSKLSFKFASSSPVRLERMAEVAKRSRGRILPPGVLILFLTDQTEAGILGETLSVLKELYGYNIIN